MDVIRIIRAFFTDGEAHYFSVRKKNASVKTEPVKENKALVDYILLEAHHGVEVV